LAAVPDLTPTAALLFLTAVVGKAVGLPVALRRMPALDAILLIVSLIPRSELALIIVDRGRALGFIPESVFLAVVLVVVATMIGVPLLLRILLRAP
jgi:Kef-type K+ transport system membrane component KefB